jgi:hypothetical protein
MMAAEKDLREYLELQGFQVPEPLGERVDTCVRRALEMRMGSRNDSMNEYHADCIIVTSLLHVEALKIAKNIIRYEKYH